MRGTDASKDVHAPGERGPDLGLPIRELRRIEDFELRVRRQTEFLADSLCGRALIAGNHNGGDTRLVEILNGVLDPRAERISHTNQSQPDEFFASKVSAIGSVPLTVR